jgi:ferredoxin
MAAAHSDDNKESRRFIMFRKIIKIDEDKCDGCGLCADACHEGAIGIVGGKAKLLRDDYCDGLGNCLPVCPTGAISFEVRDTLPFDEAAVAAAQADGMAGSQSAAGQPDAQPGSHPDGPQAAQSGGSVCACPSAAATSLITTAAPGSTADAGKEQTASTTVLASASELRQWPVQIKLVPINAPYFNGAELLIAADCAAYARAGFHAEFMAGKVTVIGCPKLDAVDYSEKLTEIIRQNDIRSLTVVRMEVPCCGGIEHAAATALLNSGKPIPLEVVTLSVRGDIIQ